MLPQESVGKRLTVFIPLLMEEALHQCKYSLHHNPLNLNIDFLLSSTHKAAARMEEILLHPDQRTSLRFKGWRGMSKCEIKMQGYKVVQDFFHPP